ncbi:hypothetical protein NTGBS_600002 [Candidatus Nitrotoga sp. BS]|nr:hypothetical protein NTGBS_600002 [Candidatus Nitrotoga sp. BS]
MERQLQKQVPAEYVLLTFTLPAEFKGLALAHQRIIYDSLIRCSWVTVRAFAQNDKQLRGTPGAIAVLDTNTRQMEYHPHVHLVMPAAVVAEPYPARSFCGGCCSMCCRKVLGGRATSVSCMPIANA